MSDVVSGPFFLQRSFLARSFTSICKHSCTDVCQFECNKDSLKFENASPVLRAADTFIMLF